ncbi:RluA family pseudouridine synthase [Amphiplicatus metriothermophilus]|uniref:Pseudouridine synthase n=1 Tax=Amphiplicatus metriothermophilus TaxID=1519374 RepID=A0A239PPX6_9PROT|nr:RluA family pseudouridine synthase [Amphiplicatus metriothermophilus]MBB5518495.1 23S rRNA pseudouridine955/2504/2580 synthase [Amphiplicatus metriothermophilus]SNT72344.1 ribosomal large subunit pseudouridine synthase C [Amphiplicatus metriothermophilus]
MSKSSVSMATVTAEEAGMRLDRWFRAHYPALRHGALEKLLRTGQIRVDGGRVKAGRRLEAGETIRVPPLAAAAQETTAKKPALPVRAEDAAFIRSLIVYEDDAVMALGKPFGLAVQGGAKTGRHIDAMLAAFEKKGERPRLVHRLDRDTGGLLLLAKTRAAAARLGGAFQRHEVEKTYWALVAGQPRPREGTIDLPIAKRMVRIGEGGQERVVPAEGEDAKKAVTDFQTMDDAGPQAAFLALRPRTGRTHQLRVHCAAMGTPIVGDGKYGGPAARLEGVAGRLHLFCRAMSFPHPATGKRMTLKAPLSGHMLETWRFFGFDENAEVGWPEIA